MHSAAHRVLALTVLLPLSGDSGAGTPRLVEAQKRFRALVFTKTTGFRHDSIPQGVAAIRQTRPGPSTLRWIRPESAGRFTPGIWRATRSWSSSRPPGRRSAAARNARVRASTSAAAAATSASTRPPTPAAAGRGTSGSSATRFTRHDPGMSERAVNVVDRGTAATRGLPAAWARTDEWYEFRSAAERARARSTRRVASAGLVPPLRWRPLGVHRNGSYEGVLRRASVRPAICSARSRWRRAARGSPVRRDRVLARACVIAVLVLAGCGGERGRAAGRRAAARERDRRPRADRPAGRHQRAADRRRRQQQRSEPGDQLGHGRPRRRDDHGRRGPGAVPRRAGRRRSARRSSGKLDGRDRLGQPRRALRRPERPARLRAPEGGQPPREHRR